jgi:hypothetical protein
MCASRGVTKKPGTKTRSAAFHHFQRLNPLHDDRKQIKTVAAATTTNTSSSTTTTMTEVFTAVSLGQNEGQLSQPLLSEEAHVQPQQPNSDDRTNNSASVDNEVVMTTEELYPSFRMYGTIVGFLVQLLNVAGSTVLYYQWNDSSIFYNSNHKDLMDTLLHLLVFLLTQVDLYLYLCMWLVLTAVLTRPGMKYIQDNYFSNNHLRNQNDDDDDEVVVVVEVTKRSVFVLGVQFYMGVVLGVFLAWTGVDCVLGLPVPVLPMLGVLFFGLLISYTMIFCYDLEESFDSNDDDDDDDNEEDSQVIV